MIHSLSGGVIADNEVFDFARVRLQETAMWFLAPMRVATGDRVLVPFDGGTAEGTVERVERCTVQTAPVSLKRTREILALLPKNS